MAIKRPVLMDADAVINLLEWGFFERVCRALGQNACLAEYVAICEVKYYKERNSNRRRPFNSGRLSATTTPRLVSSGDLTVAQYKVYLESFAGLDVVDLGERETFSLAWALDWDVCSREVAAANLFHSRRPQGCSSKHMDVMVLLRALKILKWK